MIRVVVDLGNTRLKWGLVSPAGMVEARPAWSWDGAASEGTVGPGGGRLQALLGEGALVGEAALPGPVGAAPFP